MMHGRMRTVWVLALVAAAGLWSGAWGQDGSRAEVRNVILMIGDGMGPEQVRAAGLYGYGAAGSLAFEQYKRGVMATGSLTTQQRPKVATDSAAAATALATGQKVLNGAISQGPAGLDYETVLERFKKQGKATGLVTSVPLTHATPAGFGAHAANRKMTEEIAVDLLEGSRPDVMFGAYAAQGRGITPDKAEAAGYAVVTNRQELARRMSGPFGGERAPLVGIFAQECLPFEYDRMHAGAEQGDTGMYAASTAAAAGADTETVPTLAEITAAALKELEGDEDGFFLMVEGGSIDWAGHANNLERMVYEVLGFEAAFKTVAAWAAEHPGTLVVVTADHETGGLEVGAGKGKGQWPEVTWSSKGHTPVDVEVFAFGPGAEAFGDKIENTDMPRILLEAAAEAALSGN